MKSVTIVGGGIIGMSVAWGLVKAGFAVRVVEKSTVGGEASWAGAGMLAPGGEFDEDSPMARRAVQSRDLYGAFVDELQRESELEIDLQETGALDVAYSKEELKLLNERAERQAAIGITSKRVTSEQLGTFWPRIKREELAGGYFYPGDASVNPREVVAALRIACQKRGVVIEEQTEVQTIDLEQQDALVIAAGAWSSTIEVAGVPTLPSAEPIRGHLLGYHQPAQTCSTIVRHGHTYLLQRANGLLIAGASEERVGFERCVDPVAVRQLERAAAVVMPHLSETTPTEVWNGFRPGSDELHIGRWHSDRLYLAYGHYRNGILLAPITAQLLTAEISANLQKQ